mmetsp:Transcript_113768/g.321738  ORF Transcript_113768/g.321738 Transcript_113768/m.321738 type:complete len:259 (-) Transcript_113768:26-802(-)
MPTVPQYHLQLPKRRAVAADEGGQPIIQDVLGLPGQHFNDVLRVDAGRDGGVQRQHRYLVLVYDLRATDWFRDSDQEVGYLRGLRMERLEYDAAIRTDPQRSPAVVWVQAELQEVAVSARRHGAPAAAATKAVDGGRQQGVPIVAQELLRAIVFTSASCIRCRPPWQWRRRLRRDRFRGHGRTRWYGRRWHRSPTLWLSLKLLRCCRRRPGHAGGCARRFEVDCAIWGQTIRSNTVAPGAHLQLQSALVSPPSLWRCL